MTSIIILTNNHLELTRKCIRSIRKHTPEPHEIILVDGGSTDGTQKWLQAQVAENKNWRLIASREKSGSARARNQGILAARGEHILLLEHNTIVGPGWLDGMLSCLNTAPAAGVIGPMSNKGSGLQQAVDGAYQTENYLDKYASRFREKNRHRRIRCQTLAGFCMLFSRNLVNQISLFDEDFGLGQFEEDFCLRAALEDYHNYIAGDVFIHYSGEPPARGDRNDINQKWTLSLATPEGRKLAVLKATELADTFYSKGKFDQAVEALVNCIKVTPDAQDIYYELCRFFLETKKYAEAQAVVATMPDAARNALQGLACSGYAGEGLGQDDDADAIADAMLSLHPNDSAAVNLKGVLAFKKGQKDQARDYFIRAIESDPGYGEAHVNLGVLYWGLDNKEEAFAHLQKGFNLSPAIPDVHSIYYSVLSSLGFVADAEPEFQEACRLYPANRNLAFLYIDILIRQDRFHEAISRIEDAIALFGPDEGTLNAALAVREKIGPLQIKKGRKNSLSLCMIVKNEERYLAACLKSVRDVVDEMIIVDTGSTDKTREIARVFGAKIFEFPWTGDFAVARNYSLTHAEGDWILVLDADEVISPLDHAELKTLLNRRSPAPAAYSIITRNYTTNVSIIGWTANDGKYPEETRLGWMISGKVRLFPRRSDISFRNAVHELVEKSLEEAKIPVFNCGIIVHHFGKLDTDKDTQKGEDYYLLGKMKYESDPNNAKYVSELAKQALVLNRIEEAVDLWLKLLSLIENNPQSPGYREILLSSQGDPIAETYSQLANAYLGLGRYSEALAAARKSMETPVRLMAYIHIYAQCEMIAGSLADAHAALLEILKTTPDYPPALFLEAIIACLEGKKDDARNLFQVLKQRRIGITTLMHTLARRLAEYGNTSGALLILQAAVENRFGNSDTDQLIADYQKDENRN